MKIKTGDNVMVMSGAQKGVISKVSKVIKKSVFISGKSIEQYYVLLSGVNLKTVYKKKTKTSSGSMNKTEYPIHISKIALVENGIPVRVGYKIEEGKKIRISKKSGKKI